MAINPNNGVLDIINGTLKVSSIDIKQAAGFTTTLNTVARNDVLLFDDQKASTVFTPTSEGGYMSSTGVTRDTTEGAGYIDLNDGWVYWPIQLPNSWHTEFDMHVTTTGGVLTFSLFNTSEPNHTDYTNNDGGYKIVFDNTNNQIDIYWEGSIHKTIGANLRSSDWQHVNINYFQGAISVSLAGKVVLTHEFTQNYQEFNSRYVGFSATTGASHKIRHLRVHNSDKWLYTKTSNASDITYVSGNVGIGTLTPTELLDVHGNVHIAKDLTVNGNLTVSGTTTFIDTQNLAIEDPIIEVAMGNASDTIDAGLVITRATSNVAVAYRGDEEELALGYTQSGASDTDVTPITDGGLDVRVYGNLFANNLTTTANVEATYLKGNGSEITHVTLDQVVDYGNTTANTIHLTNTDVGLKADGNVDASYFIGNGSKLTGLVTDLQSVTDNGNTTSNTVQFTNATTALIADSNVGIGTSTPSANLHVMGYQYVNGPPTLANAFDHSDAPLTLTHDTATSSTAINDPKPLLHLTRSGTNNESYGARASFNLSRYENSSTHSRSRLDVALADGTYAESTVMTLRADGNVGIGTTSPALDLHVMGGIMTQNNGTLTPQIQFKSGSNNTNGWLVRANISDTFAGDFTIDRQDNSATPSKFVIKNGGNVGIGTSSPQYKLDVDGGTTEGDGDVMLRMFGGVNKVGKLIFGRTGNSDIRSHAIESITNSGGANNYMKFLVHDGGSSSPYETRTEVMTLLGNGNVGIGTDSPVYKLDVHGTANVGALTTTSVSGDGSGLTSLNASNVNTGTFDAAKISSGTVADDTGGVKAVYFDNTEQSGYYTDKSGILAFDENFYDDTEYGTGTYDPDSTFVGGNGGGLLIKNEDGWGAIFTSQNTRWAKGYWNALDITNTVTATSYRLTGDATPYKQSIKNDTNLAVGWYRIAENGNAVDTASNGSRCSARFTIIDYDSGLHSTRTLYAGGTYGNKPFIHLLTNTSYGGDGNISKVRVVEGSTYEGLAVEIYVDTACSTNEIRIVMDDNYQVSGFTMVNFESVVANHSNMNEYELNLNTTFWGMFLDNTTTNICMLESGNVGIGTASPGYKLDVAGSFRVNGGYTSTFGNDGLLHINSRSTTNGSETVALQTTIDNRALTATNPGTHGGESRNVLALQPDGGYVGIGTPSPGFKLHVVGTSYFTNTINIQPSSTGGGQNLFTGYRTGDSYGRARLVLSSGYSDVIIASSQANNNHGSNLSFVTYNPSNAADYRKFVINQGNWGSRKQFLDFGYADKIDPNPHGYINGTDTVLTLDGINKRVGINNINPSYNLDVNGNARINRLHPYSSSYSSAYNTAAIEVREYNMEGSVGGTYWARAPRIGFHWSGRVASQILCESSGQISVVDNPGNNYENFKAKQVSASTAFYAPGHPVQYVGQNVHDIVVYGNSIGRYITPLDITITPKFSNSKIMLHWVINAEAHHDQVIRIYRFISSGASSLIGFNSNNQGVHSGAAPILYDTDHNSTLNTHTVAWVDTPNTTSAVTYRIFTRPSNNGSNWFRLNRTVGGGTLGQANHEIAVSYKSAMEIAV